MMRTIPVTSMMVSTPASRGAGDGAFGISMNEMTSIGREGWPAITMVIFRNYQWGAEKRNTTLWYDDNFVGTEHLLLGLIKLGQGVAVNVLQKLGLDLETVRMEVEKQVGTGPDQKMIGNVPFTPRVRKVLALSAKEARAETRPSSFPNPRARWSNPI